MTAIRNLSPERSNDDREQMITDEPVTLWSLREDVLVVPDAVGPGVVLSAGSGRVRLPNPAPVVQAALRRMTLGPVLLGNIVQEGDARADEHGSPSSIDALLHDAGEFVVRSLRSADALGPLLSLIPRADRPARAIEHLVPVGRHVELRLAPDTQAQPIPGAGMRLTSDGSRYEILFHRPEACWLIGRLAFPSSVDTIVREAPLPQSMVVAALAYLHSAGLVVTGPDAQASASTPVAR